MYKNKSERNVDITIVSKIKVKIKYNKLIDKLIKDYESDIIRKANELISMTFFMKEGFFKCMLFKILIKISEK